MKKTHIELLDRTYRRNAEAYRKKYSEIQEQEEDLWDDMATELFELVDNTKNKRIDFGILKDKVDKDGNRMRFPVDEECDEISALYKKDRGTLDYEAKYGTTRNACNLENPYILELYEFISKHLSELLEQEEE